MLAEFTGVLLILVVALIVAGLLGGVHQLLGPRREFPEKNEPFECGERQIVSPKQRFSVKFYLVAMLFILFDVEAVFFYPWGALFRELGGFGFVEMTIFTVPLVVGLALRVEEGRARMVISAETRARSTRDREVPEEARRAAAGAAPRAGRARLDRARAARELAAIFEIRPIEVMEVVTFYNMFYDRPQGRHHVYVCTNLPCSLRGARQLLRALE